MNRDIQIKHAIDLMPKDKRSVQVLHDRAVILAKHITTEESTLNLIHYVRFMIGRNEFYGIPYHSAKEVIDNVIFTELPCTIDCIAGVINHRGKLLTLIDLKKFFHSTSSNSKSCTNIIIVNAHNMSIGILADEIIGSQSYDEKELNAITPNEGLINTRYIIGLHQGITAILNVETIMLDLQQQLNRQEIKGK